MRNAHAVIFSITIATFAIGFPSDALAQDNVGVRIGVSGSPDQFVFGGHLESEPLLDRLVFRPTGEIGLGDDLTTVSLNFEFAYKFALSNRTWTPYVGAGPALNIYRYDGNRFRRNDDDRTDVEPGFNILIGIEHEGGLFTEFKIGALDSPELKLLVGVSF